MFTLSGIHDAEARNAGVSPQGRHGILPSTRMERLGFSGTRGRNYSRCEIGAPWLKVFRPVFVRKAAAAKLTYFVPRAAGFNQPSFILLFDAPPSVIGVDLFRTLMCFRF